jgi:hypothetical protein
MPPGFNIIWLPFSDDLRHPEFDNNFLGSDRPQGADEMQIAAASAMLKKLRLPDFIPGTVPNPHLQRHYQVTPSDCFGMFAEHHSANSSIYGCSPAREALSNENLKIPRSLHNALGTQADVFGVLLSRCCAMQI